MTVLTQFDWEAATKHPNVLFGSRSSEMLRRSGNCKIMLRISGFLDVKKVSKGLFKEVASRLAS